MPLSREKTRKAHSLGCVSSPYFTSRSRGLREFNESTPSDDKSLKFNDLPYNSYWDAVVHVVRAKPILVQESVASDPWKVLVAAMLLNVTSGEKAIPVFWTLMERWPNPATMAKALKANLVEVLQPLGLFNKRAERLITLSRQYIENPPSFDRLWKSRVPGRYPPTPVSHFVGCGRYALDSFRVFCSPGDEWTSVTPLDKELIKYLKWKWAVTFLRKWEPVRGVMGSCDEAYLWSLAPHSRY